MFDRFVGVFGVLTLVLLTAGYFWYFTPKEVARKDALKFSNTSSWAADLLEISKGETVYPPAIFERIDIPPPPTNSSKETARELEILHEYSALRTPETIRDIVTEVIADSVSFGPHTIGDYIDARRLPETASLLIEAFRDVRAVEMREKRRFDRVRPSLLDTTLETVIGVPGHPAYPSGHATETHFFAHVLSELAPEKKEFFFERAAQISKNREIAGVHYPSDSAAGKLLGEQLFEAFMQDETFRTRLAAAKVEWSTHPELVRFRASQ